MVNDTAMDTPFIGEQVYAAPVQTVWQALTDEAQMRVWYFPQLQHFTPVTGFKFMFTNDGSSYQKEWRVTKVIPGRLLAHSWTYKNHSGYSEVTFELFDEGSNTWLKLTHTGIASFPHDPHFARHRFEDGWKQILGTNLKNHLLSVMASK
jgi:uncharacterized protein YndB with AHSA1/START domain